MDSPLIVKKMNILGTVPVRGSARAAGYDLFAAYDYTVAARDRCLVSTNIAVAIPDGYYGRIAPRSSLALRNGIDVGAGVIDSDYRGNVSVVLFNHSDTKFQISSGDRIAQLIITKIATPDVIVVDEFEDCTARGVGGFGSTGV